MSSLRGDQSYKLVVDLGLGATEAEEWLNRSWLFSLGT